MLYLESKLSRLKKLQIVLDHKAHVVQITMGKDNSEFAETKHTNRLSKVHKCLCVSHQETNEKRLHVCVCACAADDGNNKAEKTITAP